MSKRVKRTAVLVTVAIACSPLWAGEKTQDDQKADPEAVRCEYKKVVNSRIPQKICLTNYEWEERRRIQIEEQRSNRNNSSTCIGSNC